jgi:hypothetical protein
MSPTFFRSSGNTTTVKGHVLWSWQKVRKVTPLVPSATCSTVPLTHWVVPTCLLASAKETQSCLEVFGSIACGANAAHCNNRSKNGPEQANQSKKTHDGWGAEKGILSFIVGVEERDPTLSRVEIFAATSRKRNLQAGLSPGLPQFSRLQAPRAPLLGERFYGRCFVVLHIEDGVELRDLQQVVYFFGEVEQLEFAALVFGGGEGADQLADA